ncbi:hypothetical protein [Terriglobus sp. RCC_193]|uniref:hypothetical protein n=1 Tax=Terriglobus sp. RCC_193 TaxID=3239218 RepID=UPI0035268201
MKRYRQMESLHRTLRFAARIVPLRKRALWQDEWVAELSYMLEEDSATALGCREGMMRDAITLRWLAVVNAWRAIDWREPGLCLRLIAILFVSLFVESMARSQLRHLAFSKWGYGAFACFIALALFSLPSTMVTSRYSACEAYEGETASFRQRFVRWRFLAGKLALLVLSAYMLALQVTQLFQHLLGAWADWVLVACGLVFNVIAASWALTDQRERCPTCMRLLKNPARMGPPSWSLLGSCATEEMCDRGHGLLHQPEWQTSWFENARWLQLDRTWKELFHP